MLKYILIVTMLIMAGCVNNQSKSDTQETDPHTSVTTQQATLQLNNGQKWKLDEATRQNIKPIKAHISQASHTSGALSGEELQVHIDKLVKECRMTGPEHDALHAWLGPFLQHVQALKKNQDAESASHALNEDIKAFDAHFE